MTSKNERPLIRVVLLGRLREYDSGSNGIDADSRISPFDGQRLGEIVDGRSRGSGVTHQRESLPHVCDDVDDNPTILSHFPGTGKQDGIDWLRLRQRS